MAQSANRYVQSTRTHWIQPLKHQRSKRRCCSDFKRTCALGSSWSLLLAECTVFKSSPFIPFRSSHGQPFSNSHSRYALHPSVLQSLTLAASLFNSSVFISNFDTFRRSLTFAKRFDARQGNSTPVGRHYDASRRSLFRSSRRFGVVCDCLSDCL